MTLALNLPALRSRTVAVTLKAKRAVTVVGSKIKGFLQKIARFAGWAFGQICKFFNLSFERIWDIIVQAYFAIKTIDWNATDEALKKQIDANNQQMVVAAADLLGTTLGWGVVRLANFFIGRFFGKKESKAAAKMKVPVLSARIGLALAEEGNEEIHGQVRSFLSATVGAQINNAFTSFPYCALCTGTKGLTLSSTSK